MCYISLPACGLGQTCFLPACIWTATGCLSLSQGLPFKNIHLSRPCLGPSAIQIWLLSGLSCASQTQSLLYAICLCARLMCEFCVFARSPKVCSTRRSPQRGASHLAHSSTAAEESHSNVAVDWWWEVQCVVLWCCPKG
jgi:hypothetical protein